MEDQLKYLSNMTKGQKGIVVDVETENCPERGKRLDYASRHGGSACGAGCASKWGATQRLLELGLTPGTELTIRNSAPLNGPLEICVRGSKIALGRDLASRILVRVDVVS